MNSHPMRSHSGYEIKTKPETKPETDSRSIKDRLLRDQEKGMGKLFIRLQTWLELEGGGKESQLERKLGNMAKVYRFRNRSVVLENSRIITVIAIH